VLPRLFERFYRGDETRRQQGGESGLGLAIAKSLVEAHGGTIAATSEGLGRGSTFTVTLCESPL
jgi:two-component system sensor histidine kinase BaeS